VLYLCRLFLTHRHKTRQEGLVRDKHSKFVMDVKSFITYTRVRCYKTFSPVIYDFCNKLVFETGKLFKPSLTNTLAYYENS
jgi:hypothetical protein